MALNTNLSGRRTKRHILRFLILKYQTHQVALLVLSAPISLKLPDRGARRMLRHQPYDKYGVCGDPFHHGS